MEPSQMMAANTPIADSLSPIEFNMESKSFHATYDSVRDSTSLAVVAVVSTALGREPLDLIPLQSVIETDALEKLMAESSTGLGNCDSISFSYEGLAVTVTSEAVIEATPIENT